MARKNVTNNQIRKQITFSPVLYQQMKARARAVGLGFAEYVRHLAANDIEDESYPVLDDETIMELEKSMRDYREGRYEEIDPSDPKQLDKAAGIVS